MHVTSKALKRAVMSLPRRSDLSNENAAAETL
jgi:hypothetical protein